MRVLQRRLQPGRGTENTVGNQQNKTKHSRNVMKIFKSIVVAFFICWFLFLGYMILKITFPELFLRDKCKLILGFAYYVFPLLSTVLNPVILFSFSSNFRQALKEICPRFLEKYPLHLSKETNTKYGQWRLKFSNKISSMKIMTLNSL